MKYNIALVGYGKWGKILANQINNSKYFNLVGVLSSLNLKKNFKINSYKDFSSLIKNEKVDCIYIAKDPATNFSILEKLVEHKLPIIFEKPLCLNSKNCLDMIKIIEKLKIISFTNLPNIFSDTYNETKKFIKSNEKNIKRIIINEGDNGPIRDEINPIFDWGIHPLTYVFGIYERINLKKINHKTIVNSKVKNIKITKLEIPINNQFKIKILTGNGFKSKTRILKIILNNGDIFINDFIKHELLLNDKVIFKSQKKPLDNLLEKFAKSIKKNKNNEGLKSIYQSYQSIQILEKIN